ncbi:hypothetical protein NL108_017187 [Boleophthalmus pectinirostris]|nr:hypothetical protein NL108_017187 [Boleophthalmus pectinirostris]
MHLSDHCPLYLKINICNDKKCAVWRLNSSLLNGQMKDETEEEMSEYVKQSDNGEVSPSILWDTCKAVMRGNLTARSTHKKKMTQIRLKTLQTDLGKLEKEHKRNIDHNIMDEIKRKKAEINEILSQEIQKNMVDTKQRYYEAGNRAAKLLVTD